MRRRTRAPHWSCLTYFVKRPQDTRFAGLVGMLPCGGIGLFDHARQLGVFEPRQFLGRGAERMRANIPAI